MGLKRQGGDYEVLGSKMNRKGYKLYWLTSKVYSEANNQWVYYNIWSIYNWLTFDLYSFRHLSFKLWLWLTYNHDYSLQLFPSADSLDPN